MSVHHGLIVAAQRAARATVVASLGFYIGRFWFDDTQFAVFATFTTIALTRLAGYRGTRAERVRALIGTVLAATVIVTLGTAVSGGSAAATIAATITTLVVVVAIALAGVGGGYFPIGGMTLVLLWVVASFIPAPVDELPSRLGGVLFSGVLTLLATELIFPERSAERERAPVAAALHALAELTELVGQPESYPAAERTRRLDAAYAAVRGVQPYLQSSLQRPIAPTAIERARIFLNAGLARLCETLERRLQVHRVGGLGDVAGRPDAARSAEAELYRAAQQTLDASAQCVSGDGTGPDVAAMADVSRRHRIVMGQSLVSRTPQTGPPQLLAETELVFVDREVAWLAASAGVQTLVALGIRNPRQVAGFAPGALGELADLDEGRAAAFRRRLRANLSLNSVVMRDALRLAIGLAVARSVVGFLALPHGFWVALAVVVTVHSSIVETRATAVRAMLGTALGFVAATAFVIVVDPDTLVLAVILPLVIFVALFVPTLTFTAGQACFTILVVVLFNVIAPGGWQLGLVRLEDVLIGTAIGAAASMIAWPRGATGQLKSALGDVVEAGAAYVQTVAHAVLYQIGPVDVDTAVLQTQQRCRTALTLARDVFAEHLNEPSARGLPSVAATRIMDSAYRLWQSGDLIANHIPGGADEALCTQLRATLGDSFVDLRRGYEAAAQDLRSPRRSKAMAEETQPTVDHRSQRSAEPLQTGAHACAAAMLSAPGSTDARKALQVLEVRAWLLALEEDLARLQRDLAVVDRSIQRAKSRAAGAGAGRAASPSPP